MKLHYAPVALLLSASVRLAAQDVQKCCGTSNSTFLLGNIDYARHTQCLYTPGDLTGETAGNIVRLYYRYGDTGQQAGNTLGDLRIALGQTQATAFDGLAFFTEVEPVLTSANYTIAPGTTGQWFAIDLTTPFPYDPTSTLIVDIRFETSATQVFGTLSTTSANRKMMSASLTDEEGELWDSLQDIGFDLDGATTVLEHARTSFTLLPNPAHTQVTLRLDKALDSPATIQVMDLGGRTVAQERAAIGTERIGLDVAALPAGTYLVQLREGNGRTSHHKLVRE